MQILNRRRQDPGSSALTDPLPSYAAGIVNYRSYSELRHCLDSLAQQSHPTARTLVVDHDPDLDRHKSFSDTYSHATWIARRNRGFAAGANEILDWVRRTCPQTRFVLLLNPDVVLSPEYAETLIRETLRHPRIALASGKLLRPDGRTLDSAGVEMLRHRRFRDRGSDRIDVRQYDRCETVFAVTGAAMLIDRTALDELQVGGEVFDEDFFTYHEDTDLAWRAGLFDWHTLYVPEARGTHRRRWRSDSRHDIDPSVRRHSFKNLYLAMIKNERPTAFLRDLPAILGREILRLGFGLLREPGVLLGYLDALKLAPRAIAKRRIIQRRAAELAVRRDGDSPSPSR